MNKLAELNKELDELIKNETDSSRVEQLAKIKQLSTEASNEESELLKKHADLTDRFKQVIINTPVTKDVDEGTGYKPPVQVPDFADFFKAEAEKLEKGK